MRMRRKKYLDERMQNATNILRVETNAFYNKSEEEKVDIIDLKQVFGSDNRVELELGCGKGQFIYELSKQNANANYLAVEKLSNVIIAAAEKCLNNNVKNVAFINCDVSNLLYFLKEKSVDRIYLNFSCPYPKKSYKNRRLTSERFLTLYKKLLKDGGTIRQKTDDEDFFEYSKETFLSSGYKIINVTEDLHNSEFAKNNIVTEYEEKFLRENKPIFYLEVKP